MFLFFRRIREKASRTRPETPRGKRIAKILN